MITWRRPSGRNRRLTFPISVVVTSALDCLYAAMVPEWTTLVCERVSPAALRAALAAGRPSGPSALRRENRSARDASATAERDRHAAHDRARAADAGLTLLGLKEGYPMHMMRLKLGALGRDEDIAASQAMLRHLRELGLRLLTEKVRLRCIPYRTSSPRL